MRVEHTSKYADLIELAGRYNATSISFQHHTFVNFDDRTDAERFSTDAIYLGFKPWDINTQRPYVPFEVIIQRW